MKKLTGIAALLASGALVLAGCSAAPEDSAAPAPEDNQVDTNTGNNDGATATPEETAPEGLGILDLKPGSYTYSYTYIQDFNEAKGYGASGTMLIGEDGSCAFDMSVVDFSEPIADGTVLTADHLIARAADMNEALAYDPTLVDNDTFTVESASTLIGMEGLWNTTFDDTYLGIGYNSIGDYAGPCFFYHAPEMLRESTIFDESETTPSWSFDSAKIKAYEDARLAEVADVMFGLEDDADTLTAAWLETAPRFADQLGDENAFFVTLGSEDQKTTPEDIVLNISSLSTEGGLGAIVWTPTPEDSQIPFTIFLPTIDVPYTLGNHGADVAAELRG